MNRLQRLRLLGLSALLIASVQMPALASDAPQTEAEKAAAARYAEDRKLCNDETNSSSRMQCLRDARAEYDKALAAPRSATAPAVAPAVAAPAPATAAPTAQKAAAPACADCGKVVSVTTGEREGKGSALGVVGGGLAGALLGNQVGSGHGRTLATIAGAAGGAYAGNKVEGKMKTVKFWTVRVQMDSGEERTFEFEQDPGYSNGSLVRVSGSTLSRR
jgi:outer membrane lipoprotein SlyB